MCARGAGVSRWRQGEEFRRRPPSARMPWAMLRCPRRGDPGSYLATTVKVRDLASHLPGMGGPVDRTRTDPVQASPEEPWQPHRAGLD